MDSIGYYGRLYRYEDAVNACKKIKAQHGRTSFHLPTTEEWNILLSYGADSDFGAKAYKSKDSWGRFGGDDRYKFGAIAAGSAWECTYCSDHIMYSDRAAYFWTSNYTTSEWYDHEELYYRYDIITMMENNNKKLDWTNNDGASYYSVRCVADLDIPLPPKNPKK